MKENGLKERRSKTGHLIDSMLAERAQLLSLMLQLKTATEDDKEKNTKLLETFRQVLVDYVAAGHFGLYERITKGKERRKALAKKAVAFYPKIEQATIFALDFDKKYGSAKDKQWERNEFEESLSTLGEKLVVRIELEDQLIHLLQHRTC